MVPGETIPGWMGVDELRWLGDRASEMDTIVEIGSWQGRSTAALCAACRGPVYAIDPFVPFGDELGVDPWPLFLEHMRPYANCVPIRCLSKDAAGLTQSHAEWDGGPSHGDPRIPPVVDMVFIDGSHRYPDVLLDIQLWEPRTRTLLCGHDRYHPGVDKAFREYFNAGVEHGPGALWFVVR